MNTLEQYVTIDTCFVNIPTNELSPDDSTELIKNNVPFDTAAFQKMYKTSASKHVGHVCVKFNQVEKKFIFILYVKA